LLQRVGVGGVFVELGFFVALAQVGDVHGDEYRDMALSGIEPAQTGRL
jgi:hypothetical protein